MGAWPWPFQVQASMETLSKGRGIYAKMCILHRGSMWLHQFRKSGNMAKFCSNYVIQHQQLLRQDFSFLFSTELQVPESIKQHLSGICLRLGSVSSSVIRELAITMKTMKKSPKIKHLMKEMKNSVQELYNEMLSLQYLPAPPSSTEPMLPLVEVIPIATMASLLIEVAERIEAMAGATEELASLAKFKPAVEKIPPQ